MTRTNDVLDAADGFPNLAAAYPNFSLCGIPDYGSVTAITRTGTGAS